MAKTQKISINIPVKLLQRINRYQKSTHKKFRSEAVREILEEALHDMPEYFRKYDWKKAEAEADEEIKAGRVKSFDTVEEFLADLKS